MPNGEGARDSPTPTKIKLMRAMPCNVFRPEQQVAKAAANGAVRLRPSLGSECWDIP